MNRRKFIQNTGLLAGSTLMFNNKILGSVFKPAGDFISQRLSPELRRFVSQSVENKIKEVTAVMADKELAWMFQNCFPNTLDTTIYLGELHGKPDTFVITGDIHAMWLRDSTAQVWPYMPFLKADEPLKKLVKGLVNRQAACILLDPYANAFNRDETAVSDWSSDKPAMKPGLHERKYELDSLCYVIRLAYRYWKETGDISIFDTEWDSAMRMIVETMRVEQRKDGMSPYRFIRSTSAMEDAPVHEGTGRPAKPVGLICSMFRPSDDASNLPYLIPSNLFAVQGLRQLSEIFSTVLNDSDFATICNDFADEVESAVQKYAIADHLDFGRIYAYESDGYGNRLFMDDANVPSLMSLAYLGVVKPDDGIYMNTRRFLLSDSNPWFLRGKAAEGQGSPHTGKNNIWPMGIILRALTSIDDKEILQCLKMLKSTHAGTGFMHESFHKDDAANFSRKWFAWANTLFGELILKVYDEHRDMLKREI
jgi:meiotically up-regulated gene 157 (Mug157) protein